MSSERIFHLDQHTLELFALKGTQGGDETPQRANANGLKVRRVVQLIRDFSTKPFDQLRILDVACGEGVYAIEAALRGAEVHALDARTERMNDGANAADRLGIKNLRFEQTDIRNVNINSHGMVDVVLLLGILYHLDQRDVFPVLRNMYEICRQFVIIDTHTALQGQIVIEHDGRSYHGKQVREHADDDPEPVRRSRPLASLDNPMGFWLTRESLFRLLHDVGFTSVCECHVPLESGKPDDRITIIAAKGEPVHLSTYPWVNDKTEEEIQRVLGDDGGRPSRHTHGAGMKQRAKSIVNGALRPFGLEIRRL